MKEAALSRCHLDAWKHLIAEMSGEQAHARHIDAWQQLIAEMSGERVHAQKLASKQFPLKGG